jgi:hypothetical protein
VVENGLPLRRVEAADKLKNFLYFFRQSTPPNEARLSNPNTVG